MGFVNTGFHRHLETNIQKPTCFKKAWKETNVSAASRVVYIGEGFTVDMRNINATPRRKCISLGYKRLRTEVVVGHAKLLGIGALGNNVEPRFLGSRYIT